ncbi:uncharacterized protein LOC9639826 [Selaginella moellendorffii]|nr:uncharacterized protein LOC9639826 [Selaginella moellendorffii]|eukprot:XP_024515938.1 uncharacterized protein LOC9639826 [Selaginella moellendorffii]
MGDASRKRQRGDPGISLIEEALGLLDELEAVYGNMPDDFLWDTTKFQTLIQPTRSFSSEYESEEYRYIGRAKAKDLLDRISRLRRGAQLQVQGAKGTGKTTVMSSITGYMLGVQKKPVVYISTRRFVESPADVLQHALLVATRGDESVAEMTTLGELVGWCRRRINDPLLFVVDDWDKFEDFPSLMSSLKEAVSFRHILVKLSSTNSRERRITTVTDKPLPSFDFDGPYNSSELETWIAQSSLDKTELKALERLTGGIPRLLRFFEEVKGNSNKFMEKIEETYTRKLFDKFIALQTTKEQLAAALDLVTRGELSALLQGPVDLTCFYKDGSRFRLLCPYLRSRAEFYIMEQNKNLKSTLQYEDIQRWVGAVRMDCTGTNRNPPRVGWNVEGLIVSVMRYQGKLWEGLEFKYYKTYKHGREAKFLRDLSTEELADGVLVGPEAFNEKALDVIYLRLEGSVLTIKAVQITVSKWKTKQRKRSHGVWQEQVLPRWLSRNLSVEHQFVYLMPESVTQDDLGEIEANVVNYINAQADPQEEDSDKPEEEDSDNEVLSVNWNAVTSQPLMFKKLGDVHRCLLALDELLNLRPAGSLEKKAIKKCPGAVVENGISRPCRRWSRTDQLVFYCCRAHRGTHIA